METSVSSSPGDLYLHDNKPQSNRNTLFIVIAVLVIVILGLAGLSAFLVLSQQNKNPGVGQCDYNGTTYQYGASFKSVDKCNTCSCSAAGVACTLMACITDTPGVSVIPSGAVTDTPSVTPTLANSLQIYFGKPSSETDYATLTPVSRPTDLTGSELYSFAINQVITGPTAAEKATGISPVLTLSGSSTCGGSSYQFSRSGVTLNVKLCKPISYVVNTGAGGAYAGQGLAANGRVYKAFEASLKINGVTKVVLKDSNNNCFAQDSGVNTDCTP